MTPARFITLIAASVGAGALLALVIMPLVHGKDEVVNPPGIRVDEPAPVLHVPTGDAPWGRVPCLSGRC